MDLFLPHIAYAETFDQFLGKVNSVIVNPLIMFLFALAVAYFLYGMLQFFGNQDNEEKRSQGKRNMIYGIIGMTVMMGVFTIMNIILNTFKIQGINPQNDTVQLPPGP
jgi:formate hydrogenlyase subunit 3/multisubunit Na+/H+ antiporter MnhD subunit